MERSVLGDFERKRRERQRYRRSKGVPEKGSPEYREALTRKHGPEGDCKCPAHIKARQKKSLPS